MFRKLGTFIFVIKIDKMCNFKNSNHMNDEVKWYILIF